MIALQRRHDLATARLHLSEEASTRPVYLEASQARSLTQGDKQHKLYDGAVGGSWCPI